MSRRHRDRKRRRRRGLWLSALVVCGVPLAGGIALYGPDLPLAGLPFPRQAGVVGEDALAAAKVPTMAEAPAPTPQPERAAPVSIDAYAVAQDLGDAVRVVVNEEAESGARPGASSWNDPTIRAESERHIVVSLEQRTLWLVEGADTLMAAPVGIGTGETFSYGEKTWTFSTPRGTRRVLAKQPDPIWTPPVWHYYEKATKQNLEVVQLEDGQKYTLSDGSYIEVRDKVVGRVNLRGQWWAWTPGMEIVFDGKIFIPPLDSPQRQVPRALGPYKLELGDGYLIHGTHVYNRESIGGAVSHGCIRMNNDDLSRLYEMVEVGTTVKII
ncbi:MAG: L,D-transpeptidase [Longimicrobiales bacterium]